MSLFRWSSHPDTHSTTLLHPWEGAGNSSGDKTVDVGSDQMFMARTPIPPKPSTHFQGIGDGQPEV